MSDKTTEALALVGVILGGLSLLSVIVILVLVFRMRKAIGDTAQKLITLLNEDGKLKNEALPPSVHEEVNRVSTKVQDAERGIKSSENGLKDVKQQLQSLLDRVTKVEKDTEVRQVSHFEHVDGSATNSQVGARMPGAQPLQRFVGSATKPAHGPSPVSPGSQSSNDSDPMSPNNDGLKSIETETHAAEGISYSARPFQGADKQDDVTVKADIGVLLSLSHPALCSQFLWLMSALQALGSPPA
eukprot:2702812-Rhodomonas_salina.3